MNIELKVAKPTSDVEHVVVYKSKHHRASFMYWNNFWKACILSKPELQSAPLTIMQCPALLQFNSMFCLGFFPAHAAMLQDSVKKYLEGAENMYVQRTKQVHRKGSLQVCVFITKGMRWPMGADIPYPVQSC